MTGKFRLALSAPFLAGLLAVGACDASPPVDLAQDGSVARGTVPVDIERAVGDSASLGGFEGTVTAVEWRDRLTAFEDGGFLVVDVAVSNTSDETRPYHFFDWRLQTPGGALLDPTLTSLDQLRSGDLAPGEGVEGTVVFELPDPAGDFRIVYQPVSVEPTRALWNVNGTLCMPGAGATPGIGACLLNP